MDEAPQYYQQPEHHKNHFKGMYRSLFIFFGGLILLGIICIIFANSIARQMPFSIEKQFVKPYEVMASRWFGDALGDQEIEQYLEQLVAELAVAMEVPESYTISVHFVESTEANAFATMGGHIFVLRGLFDSVEDENSLAMILAHEISHIKNRDPLAAMGRGVAIQMMLSYFTGNSQHSQNLATLGGELGLLSYSRAQEERSDIEAVHALNAYYGHVAGYKEFFQALIDEYGDDGDDIIVALQTHPELSDRIETMKAVIEESGYTLGEPKQIPDAIKRKLSELPSSIGLDKLSESLGIEDSTE